EPPHEVHPEQGIPPELGALVMKALEKDRTARFASALEMREALLALAPGMPTTTPAAAARSGAESGALADTALHTPRQVLSHAPPSPAAVPHPAAAPAPRPPPEAPGKAEGGGRTGAGGPRRHPRAPGLGGRREARLGRRRGARFRCPAESPPADTAERAVASH